jgi:adenosylhomocysteinase
MTALSHTADDAALVEYGLQRLDWTRSRMTMLADIRKRFIADQPFAQTRIGVDLHIDVKTAILLEVLQAGGAEIVGTGNFGSTQDEIAAALRHQGMTIHAKRSDTLEMHHGQLGRVMDAKPDIILDNGADLIALAIERGVEKTIRGATEETTSGHLRLKEDYTGKVPFPVIVINDTPLKQIGENLHAVGEGLVESFMRITNLMVNGRRFVVVGYGWCGRGCAKYLKAFGGRVAIVETDEIKALEAALDGFRVGSLAELAKWGDVFVTATGRPKVIPADDILTMRDGAILVNVGHFPWEIDVAGVRERATASRVVTDSIERFDLPGGTHVIVLSDGRLVNLAGINPKGNSIESMDIGFMLQALALERVTAGPYDGLVDGPQAMPADINRFIARAMVAELGKDELR